MLVNLAQMYSPLPSRPRSTEMVFYAPSQPDFLFNGPQLVNIVCTPVRRSLGLEWALCHSRLISPLLLGSAAPQMDTTIPLALDMNKFAPGFYDLHVKVALTDTEFIEGITTFGWRAEQAELFLNCPPDFDRFWQTALLSLPPLGQEITCEHAFTLTGAEIGDYNRRNAALPEHYDPDGERFQTVDVYRVAFPSAGGMTVHGWYAKPPGDGPFPSMLVLPGAGNNARPAPVEHARHGYAALDIQVHGLPVDLASYPALEKPVYTTPEAYSHYLMTLHAVQVARALAALPGAELSRIAAIGGSQGGRLALAAAALSPDIKAVVAGITHFAYCPWVQWTERSNELNSPGTSGYARSDILDDRRTLIESYYDVVNFAPRVQCPALLNAGLIDPVSPPGAVFAAYRKLSGPKEIAALPNIGHDWSPAFDRYAWRWLEKHLK